MPDIFKPTHFVVRPAKSQSGTQYDDGNADWLTIVGGGDCLSDGSLDTYVSWRGAIGYDRIQEVHFGAIDVHSYGHIAMRITQRLVDNSGYRRDQSNAEGDAFFDAAGVGSLYNGYDVTGRASRWYSEAWMDPDLRPRTDTTVLYVKNRTEFNADASWDEELPNPYFDYKKGVYLTINWSYWNSAYYGQEIYDITLVCYDPGETVENLPEIRDLDNGSNSAQVYVANGWFSRGCTLYDQKGRLLHPVSTGSSYSDNESRLVWDNGCTSWTDYRTPFICYTPDGQNIHTIARISSEDEQFWRVNRGDWSVLPNHADGTHLVWFSAEFGEWPNKTEHALIWEFTRDGFLLSRHDFGPDSVYRAFVEPNYSGGYDGLWPIWGGVFGNHLTYAVGDYGNWFPNAGENDESGRGMIVRADLSNDTMTVLDIDLTLGSYWGARSYNPYDHYGYAGGSPHLQSMCVDQHDGTLWVLLKDVATQYDGTHWDIGMWLAHYSATGQFIARTGFYYEKNGWNYGWTEDYGLGVTVANDGAILINATVFWPGNPELDNSGAGWQHYDPNPIGETNDEIDGLWRIPRNSIGGQTWINIAPLEFSRMYDRWSSGEGTAAITPLPANNPHLSGGLNTKRSQFVENH